MTPSPDPPRAPSRRVGRRMLGAVLTLLGWPVWRLYRALGLLRSAATAPAPEPGSPPPPTHVSLPDDWTRPREMGEAKPTLAPITLAFGLAMLALGLLVGSGAVAGLGGAFSVAGAGVWAWDAWQETA